MITMMLKKLMFVLLLTVSFQAKAERRVWVPIGPASASTDSSWCDVNNVIIYCQVLNPSNVVQSITVDALQFGSTNTNVVNNNATSIVGYPKTYSGLNPNGSVLIRLECPKGSANVGSKLPKAISLVAKGPVGQENSGFVSAVCFHDSWTAGSPWRMTSIPVNGGRPF